MSKLTSLPQAMLFDLDGTLADTLVQLAKAACESARALGITPPSNETVKTYIGNGINMLLCRVIAGRHDVEQSEIDPVLLKRAREIFNEFYSQGLKRDFTVYEGVKEGLSYFRSLHIKLAVVTNKPQVFAVPLLKCMGIYDLFDYVLGGEVIPQRKPSPEPIFYVLDKLFVSNENAMMIGDSDNDIIAGLKAGVSTVFLTYGFSSKDLRELAIDYRFDSFLKLNQLIKSLNKR